MAEPLSPEKRQRLKEALQQLQANSVFQVLRLQVAHLRVTKSKERRQAAQMGNSSKMMYIEGFQEGLDQIERILKAEEFKTEEKKNPVEVNR